MIKRFIIHLLGIQTASAVIVKNNGKILLTKRSELLVEGGKWCLPGGGINKWERSIDGAKRELFEETGLKASNLKLLFVQEEIVKRLNLHANVYVYESDFKGNFKTNWEVLEYEWFSKSDVSKMNLAFTHKDILNKYWEMKR